MIKATEKYQNDKSYNFEVVVVFVVVRALHFPFLPRCTLDM